MRFLCILAACLIWVLPAHAERRVALVIGNSAYAHVPQLANPRNDAADMAKKLEALGFDVVVGEDLDLMAMRSKTDEFIAGLDGADMALLFYAGAGLQVNGRDYMVPVDARITDETPSLEETMPLEAVALAMLRKSKVNLVFFAASRDRRFTADPDLVKKDTASGNEGGNAPRADAGMLTSFATAPGAAAAESDGRNSPFTAALIEHLGVTGPDIDTELSLVMREVFEATDGSQTPWYNSSLRGPVVLGK